MRFHTKLEVDLGVLRENFNLLRKTAPDNEVIFMVKANAYGHGLIEITQYCWKELGIKEFGVASLGEALEIRKQLPSMRARVLVFSDTSLKWEESRELYLAYNIVPVISNFEDLAFFLEDGKFSKTPLVLKVDSGMQRLGFDLNSSEKIAETLKSSGRSKIKHLMTHFASSFIEVREGDRTCRQYEAFKAFKEDLRSFGIEIEETSCANSGAIEQGIGLQESHIRPGLMLYGPASLAKKDGKSCWSGKNVSALTTNILTTFSVKKGTPIGYGGHVCHKDGIVAYIPIGYGDGFLTYYSKSEFLVEGEKARVLGRVNMDLTALFFDKEAQGTFSSGQTIKLWDHDFESLSNFAQSARTIPYQVLTAVSSRIPRSYRF